MRQFRMLSRILVEALNSLKASGISSIIVISTLAVALSLLGGVLHINSSLKQISQNLDSQLEFSVYLLDGTDTKEIAKEISKLTEVDKVEVVTKDIAWERFKAKLDIGDSSGNPLPNTLHVNIKNPKLIDQAVEKVKSFKGIEQISYAPELFGGLEKIRSIIFSFGVLVSLILAIGTAIIVSNTIQLVIRSRSLEIEIQQLIGADDWFIRGPFIIQGIFYGIAGAIFSYIPVFIFENMILGSFKSSFKNIMPVTFNFSGQFEGLFIFVLIFLLGIVVCGLSSFLCTEKYIKN